jgi:hypothetical protein
MVNVSDGVATVSGKYVVLDASESFSITPNKNLFYEVPKNLYNTAQGNVYENTAQGNVYENTVEDSYIKSVVSCPDSSGAMGPYIQVNNIYNSKPYIALQHRVVFYLNDKEGYLSEEVKGAIYEDFRDVIHMEDGEYVYHGPEPTPGMCEERAALNGFYDPARISYFDGMNIESEPVDIELIGSPNTLDADEQPVHGVVSTGDVRLIHDTGGALMYDTDGADMFIAVETDSDLQVA